MRSYQKSQINTGSPQLNDCPHTYVCSSIPSHVVKIQALNIYVQQLQHPKITLYDFPICFPTSKSTGQTFNDHLIHLTTAVSLNNMANWWYKLGLTHLATKILLPVEVRILGLGIPPSLCQECFCLPQALVLRVRCLILATGPWESNSYFYKRENILVEQLGLLHSLLQP